jgi:membrane dipeptidase
MDAQALHADALVIDAHADILCDVRNRRRDGETDVIRRRHLPRLRAGGFDALVFAIYLTPYMPESALRESFLMIDDLHQEINESEGELRLLHSGSELARERRPGRLAILLSLEGAEPLGLDLGILRLMHQLGLRALGLTWARRTMVADGNREEGTGGGLTRFGHEVVRECGRLGILIDVSHLSTAGFWDVLRIATGPVIASHSNARALCDHPRNLTDDQLRAIAATGGAVGLNAVPDFVHPTTPALDRVLDHAEHMASVMGPGHVGLGLDLIDYLPGHEAAQLAGLSTPDEAPALTAHLVQRGASEDEIRDILGCTWLRVWERVLG